MIKTQSALTAHQANTPKPVATLASLVKLASTVLHLVPRHAKVAQLVLSVQWQMVFVSPASKDTTVLFLAKMFVHLALLAHSRLKRDKPIVQLVR